MPAMDRIHRVDASHVRIPDVPFHQYMYGFLERYKDRICMINGTNKTSMTYGHVLSTSRALARGLQHLGMRCGDNMLTCAYNSCHMVCLMLGALELGAVVTTINPVATKYELTHYMSDVRPHYVYTDALCCDKVQQTCDDLLNTHLQANIITREQHQTYTSLYDLLSAHTDDVIKSVTSDTIDVRDQVAFILFSSGTTGLPKGVMLTHYNIVSFLCLRSDLLERESSLQVGVSEICPFPMYHSAGLFSGIYAGIPLGGTFIFLEHHQVELLLKTIQTYKPIGIFTPPSVIVQLAKTPLLSSFDVSSVRFCRAGAGPVKRDTEDIFQRRFDEPIMLQGYGLTETVSGFLRSGSDQKRKHGTTGTPIPGIEIKIVDRVDGHILGPNESGELYIRGPIVMKGYLNKPDATADMIDSQGWVHTGDLAYFDDDGAFYVVDRIKELIKYKENQVAPAELEALLLNHDDVIDVGVVGVPDNEAGELPRAFIVRKDGSNITEMQLHQYVNDRVSHYKKLRGGIIFVATIPRVPSGKILRRELMKYKPKSKM